MKLNIIISYLKITILRRFFLLKLILKYSFNIIITIIIIINNKVITYKNNRIKELDVQLYYTLTKYHKQYYPTQMDRVIKKTFATGNQFNITSLFNCLLLITENDQRVVPKYIDLCIL